MDTERTSEQKSEGQEKDRAETQQQNTEPKKHKKKWLLLVLLLLLLLLAGGGVYYWLHRDNKQQSSKNSTETGFAGELKATAPKIDEDYKVTRSIGTNGGIIMAQSRSGTLYTLVIPADAMLVPKTITLAPLSSSSITNYDSDSDPGVWIGPDGTGGLFNRSAYLIIQHNTKKPTTGSFGQYGPCNTSSRFFDPQWCAANNKTAFGYGVEANKVVTVSRYDLKSVTAAPTIPTGKDMYVASTTHGGSFASAKINGTKAVQLAQATFGKRSGADDEHKAEALAHVAAFNKDLSQFSDEIDWFTKAKRDYPRDLLKEAIVANQAGKGNIAQNRVDQFVYIMNRNIENYSTSFLPTVDYEALRVQLDHELNGGQSAASQTTFKLASMKASAESPANNPGIAGLDKFSRDALAQMHREVAGYENALRNAQPCQVAPILEVASVAYARSLNTQLVIESLYRAFNGCSGQADRLANLADIYGVDKVRDEIKAKQQQTLKLQNCTDDSIVHKQGLSDYGQNECNGEEPAV